jgi:hypothetical protein
LSFSSFLSRLIFHPLGARASGDHLSISHLKSLRNKNKNNRLIIDCKVLVNKYKKVCTTFYDSSFKILIEVHDTYWAIIRKENNKLLWLYKTKYKFI